MFINNNCKKGSASISDYHKLIFVNSAVTMFTLVTVDINLCHACRKSINNTQNAVERHPGPYVHSRLAS